MVMGTPFLSTSSKRDIISTPTILAILSDDICYPS